MPDDNKPKHPVKRYATAAIILGGGAVLSTSALMSAHSDKNYGVPITHNGQKYFIPNDSKRAIYPSREACLRDVPANMQSECEPVSNYRSGSGLGWYGPVFSSRNSTDYRPSGQYVTETADGSNTGKQLPKSSNSTGFGANGKAFTGSKGG